MQPKCPIEWLREVSQLLSYTNWVGIEQFKGKVSHENYCDLASKIAELREIYVWEYKLREKKKMSLDGLDHPMFTL